MAFLDVRPELAAGREPFMLIMNTVAHLSPGESLEVMSPFEPIPLYHVMEARGFEHVSHRTEDGSWQVTFRRIEDD